MEIDEQRLQGVPVLSLQGRVGYKETPRLKEELSRLVQQGHKHLILDMSDVDFLCSWAIGNILTTNGRLRKDAGGVCLSRVKPELKELLDLLGLQGTLKTYPTTKDAARAVGEKE